MNVLVGKYEKLVDDSLRSMIDKISCGVEFGKWDKNFFNLDVHYPACDSQRLVVVEEYKDKLFIEVCSLYLALIPLYSINHIRL